MTLKIAALVVFSAVWMTAAAAQSSAGGPSKQNNYVGGPAPHPNPVTPASSANGGKSTPGTTKKK